jgi:hypothetical protein
MKIISKKQYKVGAGVISLAILFSVAMWASYVHGEQVGGAPESGSTSYIKSLYTDLQTSGYGSDTASPDWGAYWNRLKTAAMWAPNGTATAADVTSGKTFYGSDRTQQTGALPKAVAVGNCPTQVYSDMQSSSQSNNCTDKIIWTAPNDGVNGTQMKDPISGLIWSQMLISSGSTITFSTTTSSGWSWDASGSANVAVGNKTAAQVCTSLGNGWRLPAQKELMQAYIDGSKYNLMQDFSSGYDQFWSSTIYSGYSSWNVSLKEGIASYSYGIGTGLGVRCVR